MASFPPPYKDCIVPELTVTIVFDVVFALFPPPYTFVTSPPLMFVYKLPVIIPVKLFPPYTFVILPFVTSIFVFSPTFAWLDPA